MPAPTVADHFNPVSHSLTRSIAGCPALPVVELGLKCRPERLSHRIIETHSGTPHRLSNAQVAAYLLELLTGKLGSAVSVKHQPVRNITAQRMCHPQRSFNQGRILNAIHSPPQYPAGMAIADRI